LFSLALIALLGAIALSQGWISISVGAQAKTPTPQQAASTTVLPTAVAPTTSLPRTVTVVGEGTVRIKPDIARAAIGVETLGRSVKVATAESAKTMAAIIAALKSMGVSEKDIQTSGFSVWADRPRSPEGALTGEATYYVSNMVNVTIRDLDKVGELLDAAIEAGANSIHGVSFAIDQPKALQSEARQAAASDALAKAKELATLHNAEVGAVVSVSEIVGSGGGYYDSNFAAMEMMSRSALGGAGAISQGELELSLRLQVVYELR
jgi:hypothetical protein